MSISRSKSVMYVIGLYHVNTENIVINWIGLFLLKNCPIKRVIKDSLKGREDKGKDVSCYWTTLRKTEVTGKWGRTRLQSLENSVWKRLWNYIKADYTMLNFKPKMCVCTAYRIAF